MTRATNTGAVIANSTAALPALQALLHRRPTPGLHTQSKAQPIPAASAADPVRKARSSGAARILWIMASFTRRALLHNDNAHDRNRRDADPSAVVIDVHIVA